MEEKSCVIAADGVGVRCDIFLRRQEPELSRTAIQALIARGEVRVNGKPVKAHRKLRARERLVWRVPEKPTSDLIAEDIPFDILYEDNEVLVLHKPSGLVVHPGAGHRRHTLVHALLHHTSQLSMVSQERPGIVHRLDKDTSGVMVVAKTNAAHLGLVKQFRKHAIQRRYIALVEGRIEFEEGLITAPIKRHRIDRKKMSVSFTEEAKEASTRYQVLKRFGPYTAVALYPQTGRTHQLRVHLAFLGHPVLGDEVYGSQKSFSRLALHAIDLGFAHPKTGQFLKFSAPLPEEMKAAMPGVKIERR